LEEGFDDVSYGSGVGEPEDSEELKEKTSK